jgi:hypothetical protein
VTVNQEGQSQKDVEREIDKKIDQAKQKILGEVRRRFR